MMMMGLLKEEKTVKKVVLVIPRWMKTLLFLINMLISLLLFSAAPILVVAADALLPSACFSAASSLSLSSHLSNYDFRSSLVDIPLLSLTRSAIILCVYSLCDGPRLSRGPYLAIATVCSAASLVVVSLKASYIFMISNGGGMVVALFVSSAGLAFGHVLVAYRICCRERRKLLVYKIDIEAWWCISSKWRSFSGGSTLLAILIKVSACKNGFPRYHQKILQESRTK